MKKKLGEKSVLLWWLRLSLTAFPLFFLFGIMMTFYPYLFRVLFFLCIFAYLIAVLLYFPLLRKNTFLILYQKHLEWNSGVVFRYRTAVKFERILYLSLSQNLLQKMFGLCTLTIHPVGRPVHFNGLTIEDGIAMKTLLEENNG